MPNRPTTARSRIARELEHVEERTSPPTPVIYEVVRRHGDEEMQRPAVSLWWSGVAAGLSISFSLLAQAILNLRLPDTSWSPLVSSLGYSVGFVIVILSRQQLFTENTVTVVLPVMAKPTPRNLLYLGRMWSIVLAANLTGTLFAALLCHYTPVVGDDLRAAMVEIGRHMLESSPTVMFFKAVSAGFLMAAMVWALPGSGTASLPVIVIMTYLIAIGGFAHIVAGSMEAFLVVAAGDLGPGSLVARFLAPTLIGNVVGGTGLFALLAHAQVMKEL